MPVQNKKELLINKSTLKLLVPGLTPLARHGDKGYTSVRLKFSRERILPVIMTFFATAWYGPSAMKSLIIPTELNAKPVAGRFWYAF